MHVWRKFMMGDRSVGYVRARRTLPNPNWREKLINRYSCSGWWRLPKLSSMGEACDLVVSSAPAKTNLSILPITFTELEKWRQPVFLFSMQCWKKYIWSLFFFFYLILEEFIRVNVWIFVDAILFTMLIRIFRLCYAYKYSCHVMSYNHFSRQMAVVFGMDDVVLFNVCKKHWVDNGNRLDAGCNDSSCLLQIICIAQLTSADIHHIYCICGMGSAWAYQSARATHTQIERVSNLQKWSRSVRTAIVYLNQMPFIH